MSEALIKKIETNFVSIFFISQGACFKARRQAVHIFFECAGEKGHIFKSAGARRLGDSASMRYKICRYLNAVGVDIFCYGLSRCLFELAAE